jgi:hypothetical protein
MSQGCLLSHHVPLSGAVQANPPALLLLWNKGCELLWADNRHYSIEGGYRWLNIPLLGNHPKRVICPVCERKKSLTQQQQHHTHVGAHSYLRVVA